MKKLTNEQIRVLSQEIFEKISEPFEKEIAKLKAENSELRKNAKQIADKELKKEIEQLKERLEFSFGEFASKKELAAYKAFCKKHKHPEQLKGMEHIAGWVAKFPYVVEESTSMGHIVRAVCPICGSMKDLTDIGAW